MQVYLKELKYNFVFKKILLYQISLETTEFKFHIKVESFNSHKKRQTHKK